MFKKPRRPVKRVFLHCTAYDKDLRGQELYDWLYMVHCQGRPHRWSDIGYHYCIDKDGLIIECRDLEKTPAAQVNHKRKPGFGQGNYGTIAICLNGLTKSKFTLNQFNALKKLCKEINQAYDGQITFHGHREIAYKECPVFDYRFILGLDDNGRMR